MATNLWKQFESILPRTPKLYCEIIALESGRVKVQTPSGGKLYALGSGTVGAKVWVQDGKIIGDAPSLTHYDITI